jgi:hypothetical protein
MNNKPMRVGIFCEAGCRYKYPHPLDLGELLAERGAEVVVFGPPAHDVESWNRGRGFRYIGLGSNSGRPSRLRNFMFLLKACRHVPRLHAIIACTTSTLPVALFGCLYRKKKIFYYAFELAVPGESGAGFCSRFQYLLRYTRTRVFTTGRHRSRLFRRAFGLSTIPGQIDCSALRRTRTLIVPNRPALVDMVRDRVGARPKLLVALNGGLNELNYLDVVLDACIPLASGIAVAMFGPVTHHWLARIEAARHETGNYLYFEEIPGTRYELIRLLGGVDLGLVLKRVSPALTSNDRFYTPNKLYDFIAAGVPVICTNQLSLRFVEKLGVGTILAPPTAEGLRALLLRLSSPEGSKAIRRMRARAERLFLDALNYESAAAPLIEEVLR